MRKVTVGFKCDSGLKLDLLEEATESGITLSEYVESLCENRHYQTERVEYIEVHTDSDKTKELEEQLHHYEVVLLGNLFDKYEGTNVTVLMPDGTVSEKYIKSPQDVLEVILESIKTR